MKKKILFLSCLGLVSSSIWGANIINLVISPENNKISNLSANSVKIRLKGTMADNIKKTGTMLFKEKGDAVLVYSKNIMPKNFTFSIWLKPDETNAVQKESILKGPCGNGYDSGYRLFMQNQSGGKKVCLHVNFGNKTPSLLRGTVIPVNAYSHIAFTYNHKKLILYINGKIAGQLEQNKDIKFKTTKGKYISLGMAHYVNLKGTLAKVNLFDEALSEEKIKELYLAGKSSFKQTTGKESIEKVIPTYYKNDKLFAPNYNICRNLLQNPSFESGLRYWDGTGGLARIKKRYAVVNDPKAPFGNKCLQLKVYKNANGAIYIRSFAIPARVNANYTLSFYAKSTQAKGKLVFRVCSGEWPVFALSKKISLEENWKRYSFTLKSPNNTLCISFWPGAFQEKDFDIHIDAIQLERGNKLSDFVSKPITAELCTNRFNNLLQAGETINARLKINTNVKTKGFVNLSLVDIFGKNIFKRKKYFSSPGNGEVIIPIDCEHLPRGLFSLRADFVLDNGFKDSDFFRLGIMEFLQNKHKNKDIFAVGAIHLVPDPNTAMEFYKHIGIGASVPFHLKPSKKLTELYMKHNFLVLYSIFCRGNKRYIKGSNGKYQSQNWKAKRLVHEMMKYSEADIKDIEQASYTLVKENPKAKYWKLINEPGNIEKDKNMKKFLHIMKRVSKSIKKANPNAKISSPDPTNMYHNGRTLVERMVKGGLLTFVDIIGTHPYRPRPEEPDLDVDAYKFIEMLDKYGFKGDIWWTEGMYYTPYNIPSLGLNVSKFQDFWRGMSISYDLGEGEKIAAAYTARSQLVALKYAKRVKMFVDWSGDNYYIGLQKVPRAYCWASNTLGNILGNANYIKDIDISDSIRCYLFEDEHRRPVAVLWNIDKQVDFDNKKPSKIVLPFDSSFGKIELIDFMGNIHNYKRGDLVSIDKYPVFVRGNSGKIKELTDNISNLKTKGDSLTLLKFSTKLISPECINITVRNKTLKQVNGIFSVNYQTKKLTSRDISLKAKEAVNIKINLPDRIQPLSSIPLKFSFKGRNIKCTQINNHLLSLIYCHKRTKAIVIDGNLDDWDNNKKLSFPNNFKEYPIPVNLLKKYTKIPEFKGKSDLSATFYTAWDEDNFYVAVKVKDDILKRTSKVSRYFKNDSLQLYFDTFNDAQNNNFKGYDNNDYSYAAYLVENAGLQISRNVVPEWQLCFLKTGKAPEVKRAFKKCKDGYVYELKFPAKSLSPIKLKENYTFGFAMLINDNDNDFRKRALSLTPNGTEPYMKPHLWPSMILIDNDK